MILGDNLHTIAISHRMDSPNLLAIKARRWTPDAGTTEGCTQLLMYFRGYIENGCSWLHCQWFLVYMFVVAQIDADQTRELPYGFFHCSQALVINNGDPNGRKIGNGCLQGCEISFVGLIHLGGGEHRWQIDTSESYFGSYILQHIKGPAYIQAIDDGIGTAQDTQERTTSAVTLGGARK